MILRNIVKRIPDYQLIERSQILEFTNPVLYDWHARPDMVKRNGIIILVTKESNTHALGGGFWNINFSNNDGETWTANNVKIGGGSVSGFPYTKTASTANQCDDAELILCANGDLLFITHERLNTTPPDDWITNWQHRSTDGGNTWTAEFNLATKLPDITDARKFWAFYDYKLDSNGDLYILCSQYIGNNPSSITDTRVSLYKSTDNGLNYSKVSDIFGLNQQGSGPYVTECGLMLFPDSGKMVAISRTTNLVKNFKRVSLDRGQTWGPIIDLANTSIFEGVHQPRFTTFSSIPNRVFLSGRDFIGFNFRRNSVWYSDDECETWREIILDDTYAQDAGYTKLVQKQNGDLYAVGYYGTESASRMYDYTIRAI